MKDGWHRIKGYEVFVEDNCIIRGTAGNNTTWPYLCNKRLGCYVNKSGVKASTFARGNYVMK